MNVTNISLSIIATVSLRKSEIICSRFSCRACVFAPSPNDKNYDWTTTRRHVENRTDANWEDISSFWIFSLGEAKFLRYIAKFIKLRRVATIDINNYRATWRSDRRGGGIKKKKGGKNAKKWIPAMASHWMNLQFWVMCVHETNFLSNESVQGHNAVLDTFITLSILSSQRKITAFIWFMKEWKIFHHIVIKIFVFWIPTFLSDKKKYQKSCKNSACCRFM